MGARCLTQCFFFCLLCSGISNPGRHYDENSNLSKALRHHYDPKLAEVKIIEVHKWLTSNSLIEENKLEDDWKPAYDLRTWEEFPGDIAASIVLSRIDFGNKTRGPTQESSDEAQYLRSAVRKNAQLTGS